MKQKGPIKRNRLPKNQNAAVAVPSIPDSAQEKKFDIAIGTLFLLLGTFISINYFGFQVMPTSDMPAYLAVGHDILSFHLPADLARPPVLGILQVILSWFVGGQYPEITAGWLLNAILYPINLLLLWLVGRKVIGNSAIWLAIIVAVNPWTIQLLADPIAETPLLFFILMTFYLIFRQSKWCYVLASVASMLRYECVAMIFAAFIFDFIHYENKRERARAFIYMVLACLPLAFWMLETLLHWQSQGPAHYLRAFTPEFITKWLKSTPIARKVGFLGHLNMLWRVGFGPLLMADPNASQSGVEAFQSLSKILVAISFMFGLIWGLIKKNWHILSLLIFFVPYLIIHAAYPYLVARYYQTPFWIVTFIGWYGIREIWRLINRDNRIPRPIVVGLQIIMMVVVILWINMLIPFMGQLQAISPRSDCVPYVVIAALAGIIIAYAVIYKTKGLFTVTTASVVMLLIVVSNQFVLASILRDGQREAEFVKLAQWCVKNLKQNEKIALYMAGMVRLYAQPVADRIVPIPIASNKTEFAEKCAQNNIAYVVWASREGLNPNTDHYMMTRLDNIEPLKEQRDTGAFKYITTLQSAYGYLNIFQLRKASNSATEK